MKYIIDGKYLKSSYSVYIIELTNNKNNYYYIGQTGDSNYVTARSVFRRLSGHLSDLKSSTQNQLYRFIANKILDINPKRSFSAIQKKMIEEFLVNSIITTYSYKILDFNFLANKSEHKKKWYQVVEFEKRIIKLFIRNNKQIINKRIPKTYDKRVNFEKVLKEIRNEFKLKDN